MGEIDRARKIISKGRAAMVETSAGVLGGVAVLAIGARELILDTEHTTRLQREADGERLRHDRENTNTVLTMLRNTFSYLYPKGQLEESRMSTDAAQQLVALAAEHSCRAVLGMNEGATEQLLSLSGIERIRTSADIPQETDESRDAGAVGLPGYPIRIPELGQGEAEAPTLIDTAESTLGKQ